MALTFGGASSDRITVTAATSINSLNPLTWCFWVYCTTRTSNRFILAKNSTSQKAFRLNGTTGDVEVLIGRTSGLSYITNSTPLATNRWQCFVVTFDSTAAAGSLVQIYSGFLGSPTLTAATFGTATDGSGAVASDSSQNLIIANNSGTASAFQGRIARVAIFNRVLTLGEAIQWKEFTQIEALGFKNPPRFPGCVLDLELNQIAGSLPDWAGYNNAGVVTGTTLSDHLPLAPKSAYLRRRRFAAAVSGARIPVFMNHYQQQGAA